MILIPELPPGGGEVGGEGGGLGLISASAVPPRGEGTGVGRGRGVKGLFSGLNQRTRTRSLSPHAGVPTEYVP